MHYAWGDKTIGWLYDAAEYTGFYRNLAALLLPEIKLRGTLCDMGCGMALADMALADQISSITCVDVNGPALTFAQSEARRRGIGNIDFRLSDGLAVEGRWDTVMALFHGRVDKICAAYLAKAGDRLICVTHGSGIRHAGAFCENADEAAAWLDAGGWTYTRTDGVLEFGQPHRSLEEAMESTAAFHKDWDRETLEANVRGKVQETGREDFPWYTPKTRSYGIFVIPRAGNAHLL